MGVVEIPGAGSQRRAERTAAASGARRGASLQGQPARGRRRESSAPRRAKAMETTPSTRADREPIDDRPEQRRHEVAVAVHVGVGVGGRLAEEIERVLPAEAEQDRHQDEDADHNAVAHKLVRDHGLDEEGEKRESEHLREGHEVEFFEILQQLVMVVAGDGLHDDAARAWRT